MDANIFAIDTNKLDREWKEQPQTFFCYAKQLADAKEKLDEAKAKMDLAKAELDAEIRENPEAFGVVKITEGAVTSAIIRSAKFGQFQATVRTIKHEADVLQAAVSAFDQRKCALENLVKLHGQNYFATPQATGEDQEEMETRRKKAARKKVRDALNEK